LIEAGKAQRLRFFVALRCGTHPTIGITKSNILYKGVAFFFLHSIELAHRTRFSPIFLVEHGNSNVKCSRESWDGSAEQKPHSNDA
jgi:hypothetical protein